MKLKILALAAGVAMLASCGPSYRVADTSGTTGTSIPSPIQSSFTAQYPTAADVAWSAYDINNVPIDWDLSGWPELADGDYVAVFNMKNDKYYAWYDAKGNWIGSTYAVSDYKILPAAVSSMISEKYPDYTISSVNSEMQKDKMAYEIVLKNGDSKAKLLVDPNGSIIKEKKVTKQ